MILLDDTQMRSQTEGGCSRMRWRSCLSLGTFIGRDLAEFWVGPASSQTGRILVEVSGVCNVLTINRLRRPLKGREKLFRAG